ncbi:PEST proteolytic signal-containing nuclear protein [Folsomia candida]|uniref:PEST proteolytic signal-containing nuclear protein n=1 Tax=Folsomia candida TaxID=158441 RepID=UPI0016053704|nr:PEST proteolytic signal-containing nuclear protein [Folsomia candida]
MYNTASSSDGRERLFVKWFRTFPGSSSSLGKNYSSYNNKYTKGEERYGDNGSSSNSRSSRTDEKDNRSQKRKSRWDVEGRTRDNHHPVMEQKERKSRSRSPINNKCQDPKNCYLNGFISTPKTPAASGIQIKMIQPIVKPASKAASALKPKIASVFNVDDDDDEEEMPPECKMRMKNIGRETPTSAGPNSFGKTKLGFCNSIQIKERKLEEEMLCRK